MEKINEDLAWEAVKTEHLVQDEWIDFRRVKYRFPDGKEFEPFYNFSRRDYAVIVATDEEGKYICVKQYRHGIKEVTTEFVAGGLERIDGKLFIAGDPTAVFEDALDGAKRELLEETGYVSDDWTKLIKIPSAATIADNYAHVFVARNCRRIAGQSLDEMEFLNVEKYTEEGLEKLVREGKFQQAVHVMAWLMAKEKRERDKVLAQGQ
ncbi:MAG: NUDIX hydrolase [Acetatifactor sp.]|nr:NUDIX hydrolase [Acetatifactor sp.]